MSLIAITLFALLGLSLGEVKTPTIDETPYFVIVRSSDGKQSCLGAILSPNLVITPLSCIETENLDILAGTLNTEATEKDADVQLVKAKSIDRRIFGKGIYAAALITLEKDLVISKTVQPIKMMKTNPPAGTKAVVYGWGKDLEANQAVKQLTCTEANIESYDDCFKRQSFPNDNDLIACLETSGNTELCKAFGKSSLITCKDGGETVLCALPFGDQLTTKCGEAKSDSVYVNVLKSSLVGLEKYNL